VFDDLSIKQKDDEFSQFIRQSRPVITALNIYSDLKIIGGNPVVYPPRVGNRE
jgi:hypothetical protein